MSASGLTAGTPLTRAAQGLRATRARGPLVIAAGALLVVFVAAAVLAPVLAPWDPDALDLAHPYAGLSVAHPLGTDASGRDTLSRLMYGARISLLAPLLVLLGSTALGLLLGAIAGWLGGIVDAVVGRVLDIALGFPGLLLAMLVVALFGPGVVAPAVALTIAYAPYTARLVRSLVLTERAKPYVASYRVQGFSGTWTAVTRVLPNISPTILAQSGVIFGYALVDLAALSFLGLGVQPPTADWGSMVNASGAAVVAGHPLSAFVPGVALVLVVIAVNLIGEDVADRISGRRTR